MQLENLGRRRLIKFGLASGSLFLPMPYARVWAQSDGTLKLLRLPKIALVLGNSKYKDVPLKNPANDARAIGEALAATGFKVNVRLDATHAEMAEALATYVKDVAARQCVGLFYYAGHGVQLAWRNYILPVDADIATISDIQKQGLEVNALLEGLNKAANPMNMIILDACRDNPFGNLKGVDQKGLSQMDAPQNTLLAYATSPGNVASDGEGANGLYTENLLRELKIPAAKVEDVFKRVRLGVRVSSKGAQIPWESTSLEDDFWFIPPKELKQIDQADQDRQFEEELALWEKIKLSADPAPLENFLRRYPSGPFSELAQTQLERALAAIGEKRVRIASQEGNPFTRGSSEANMNWQAGDRYAYKNTDLLKPESSRNITQVVTEVSSGEVHYANGLVTDLLGNLLRRPGGRIYSPNQLEPLEYVVGKQWVTRFRINTPSGAAGNNEMELRIVARESVTVPAGTFNAFRIEGRGVFAMESGGVEVTTLTKWVAPDRLRREVAMEETRERSGGNNPIGRRGRRSQANRITQSQRWELLSFTQK